jgi:hypothetical protein
VDVLSIVLAVGTALGGGGTVFMWADSRGEKAGKKRRLEIQAHVSEAIGPVQKDVSQMHAKLDHLAEHSAIQVKAALYEALEPLKDQIATLNTKIEPLWTSLVQSALHNAEVLHHPDPGRAHMDRLLEHFRDNILTRDEELELRRYLVKIKDWEPGEDLGFPVYETEPSSAANLLSMLDLVRIYRESSRR